MDATTIYHKNQHSVNVKKMVKGYSWEIKVYGDDIDTILKTIKDTDIKLRTQYPE